MAAWVEATTRELSKSMPLINQSKPSASSLSGDTGKPALGPKPHLMPKPFALQRNATVRPIKAPKIDIGKLSRAASSDALDFKKSDSGETQIDGSIKANGTLNAAPKPSPLTPKPALTPKPKSVPEPNKRTSPNTRLDVNAISAEDANNVQPRSRAKSLGSQDQKPLRQKPETGDADAKVSSPGWRARNRLSVGLTSMFESSSKPERDVSSVRRDTETSRTDKPPLSPIESRFSKPQVETGEAEDEEISGSSIKRRISLLFDRSSASHHRDAFNKKDTASPEISVDIKQRIKNLSLTTHEPRVRLSSAGAVKCQPHEKTSSDSDEPSFSEESLEKPAQSTPVHNGPPKNFSPPNTVPEKNVLLENKKTSLRSTGELGANVEEEDEVEEDKENHVAVPLYRRVGITKDLERKRQEEEEEKQQQQQQREEQLEKESKEQEREKHLEKERKRAEEERRSKEERKQKEEKQRQIEEQKRKEEERMKRIEEEKKLEEERKRDAEKERQREQERLDREKQIEEQKRRIEEKREQEKQREEQRLRQLREKEEKLRKEREMEEKRQIEEERLRQQRNKEERLKKERELEEQRVIEEEKRMRQEREKEERLKKEREIEEKRQIEEEKRLRQEREKEERLRKEREMEEKRQIEEEKRLRQEREERLRKEREMEEKRRIENEERLRQEREQEERLRKEREIEEKRRIEEQQMRQEREREERLKKEREMEEKRRIEEQQMRQEREREERLRKEREMEEKRRFEEEKRLRQEREERLRKERELEEKRRVEEQRMRQEREKEERLKKEREMEEKRLIEEEKRLRQEREERLRKERELEEKRKIEEQRMRQEREREERLIIERELEKKRRIEEEERLRQERENERLQMKYKVERMREEVPTSYDLISFDTEEPKSSRGVESIARTTSVSPKSDEVVYDDFSVKPRRWGTRERRSSTPSPSRESPTVNETPDWLQYNSSNPGSQGLSGDQNSEISKQPQIAEESEPEDLLGSEHEEVTSHETELKDRDEDEDEEQDTFDGIREIDETNNTDDDFGAKNRVNQALQRLTSQVTRRSIDSETPPDISQPEPILFPEPAAPLLDSSLLRSKIDLGKKRSIKRMKPSRSVRQRAALPSLTEDTTLDWRFCDSTDAKAPCSNGQDSESEEEPNKDATPTSAPSQPKRVPLFPGMDQSALMAQLKRRSVMMETSEASEDQTSPVVSARSPRTPTRSLGPRVLPPVDSKDGGGGASPSWLLELKSKKRLSQPESDV